MSKPREFLTDGILIYDKQRCNEIPNDFPEDFFDVIEKSAADKLAEALDDALGALASSNRILNDADIRHINKTGHKISDVMFSQARHRVQTQTNVLKKALKEYRGEK